MNRSDLIRAMIDLGKVIETIEGIEGIKPKIKRRDVAALEAIITDYARQLTELVTDEEDIDPTEDLDVLITGVDTYPLGDYPGDVRYTRVTLVHSVDERP